VSTRIPSYCKLHQRHAANSISVTVRAGTPLSWGSRAETRMRQCYALRRTCYTLRRTCSERNSAPAHSPSEGDTRDHTRTILVQLRLAVRALLQRREGIVRMRTHLIRTCITYLYSIYERSAGRQPNHVIIQAVGRFSVCFKHWRLVVLNNHHADPPNYSAPSTRACQPGSP
jgi:hypothetical protein